MNPKSIRLNIEKVVHTCTLTAKSGEILSLSLRLSDLPEQKAKKIYKIAKQAFRDVEVVSEITGEVLLTHYTSDEWFVPLSSYGSVINTIVEIYEGE